MQQCHYDRSKGSARLRRSTSLSPFEGEDDKWREWARVFRSWSGRFFGVALAAIYEHVEGHRNESLRFDAGLLRSPPTAAVAMTLWPGDWEEQLHRSRHRLVM